ncbi:hypothetical protein BD413DRAFT_221869 [Trametes elegans]|nr:hypothetical protein BD413DRAFT_221869 [Trametes elegans]
MPSVDTETRQEDPNGIAVSVFPVEIYELIIDAIACSEPRCPARILKSCSLTCKAWVWRSQFHLFHRIVAGVCGGILLRKLAKALDHAPHLRSNIRELEVFMPGQRNEMWLPLASVEDTLPLLMRGSFVELHTLRISGTHRDGYSLTLPPTLYSGFYQFRRLTTLSLHDILFPKFSDFSSLLLVLSDLETLGCDLVLWRDDNPESFPSAEYSDSCRLSHLVLKKINTDPSAQCTHAEGVRALFDAVERTLIDLTIPAHALKRYDNSTKPLLSRFPALQVLHVHWIGRLGDARVTDILADAFSLDTHSNLREVVFYVPGNFALPVQTHNAQTMSGLCANLAPLDRALASHTLSSLSSVAFSLEDWQPGDERWFVSVLKGLLPRTHERGVLRFCGTTSVPSLAGPAVKEVEFSAEGVCFKQDSYYLPRSVTWTRGA